MSIDARPKLRVLTLIELKVAVDILAAKDPNAPVQIGVCVCGARIMTFKRDPTVNCARCEAETSVKPIAVRA